MPPSRSKGVDYSAEEELLLQALESGVGKRLRPKNKTTATKAWATHMRHQLNRCRVANRRRAMEMYQPEDAKYGKSEFDSLIFRCGEDGWGWYVDIVSKEVRLAEIDVEDLV